MPIGRKHDSVDDVLTSRYGRPLTWLEQLPSPEIAAPDQVGCIEGYDWYVPVGDNAGLYLAQVRNARHHNSVDMNEPVSWAWQSREDEADEQRCQLEETTSRITHIGSSRGPALVMVKLLGNEVC